MVYGVLVVAAGADWESRALAAVAARRELAIVKRCVDVADLMAAATTGQAHLAVVDAMAPGLDQAAVEHLDRHSVRVVAIAPHASKSTEALADQLAKLGLQQVVSATELASLGQVLARAATPEPTPAPTAAKGTGPSTGTSTGPSTGTAKGPSAEVSNARGKVFAVWGPAGAPGRSTVAAAMAAELARRDQQVSLLDVDPMGGTLAPMLGVLDEAAGLLTAARQRSSGVLQDKLPEALREVSPGLMLLSGLPRANRWAEARSGLVEDIVEVLAQMGPVVLDCGQSLEHDPAAELAGRPNRQLLTLAALAVADEVLVVGLPDPIGITRLARGLVELAELGGSGQVRVVVNRMRDSMNWSPRYVEGLLRELSAVHQVHYLPDDQLACDRALAGGKTLLEGSPGALTKAIADLVDSLLPDTAGLVRQRTTKIGRRP